MLWVRPVSARPLSPTYFRHSGLTGKPMKNLVFLYPLQNMLDGKRIHTSLQGGASAVFASFCRRVSVSKCPADAPLGLKKGGANYQAESVTIRVSPNGTGVSNQGSNANSHKNIKNIPNQSATAFQNIRLWPSNGHARLS
jgi:hypothetical protein